MSEILAFSESADSDPKLSTEPVSESGDIHTCLLYTSSCTENADSNGNTGKSGAFSGKYLPDVLRKHRGKNEAHRSLHIVNLQKSRQTRNCCDSEGMPSSASPDWSG